MKTTIYLLLVVSVIYISACSKDSTPVAVPPTPDPNGTLVYSAPDSISSNMQRLIDRIDLTGFDSLIVTYDFKERFSGNDTAHTWSMRLSVFDSTFTYNLYNWQLPFNQTFNYVSWRKNIEIPDNKKWGPVYLYTYGNYTFFTIRNLKIYKK